MKRVCYGELGCFEDSGPFAYLEMLPSSPEEINTKFYFYSTRQRSDRPLMELSFLNMTAAFARAKAKRESESGSTASPGGGAATTNASAGEANVTTEKPPGTSKKSPPPSIDDLEGFDELSVRVIVHGFGSACPHVWIYEMKTALMAVVGSKQVKLEDFHEYISIFHSTGGLHCDLCGLGEWGHVPELCASSGEYAPGGQTVGHVVASSGAAQGAEFDAHPCDWFQSGRTCLWIRRRRAARPVTHHGTRSGRAALRGTASEGASGQQRCGVCRCHSLQWRESHTGRSGLLAAHGSCGLLSQWGTCADRLLQSLCGRRHGLHLV